MKILIIGLNYAPERIGIARYTTGVAEALAAAGHDVHVIAAQPYYPMWAVPEAYRGAARETLENGVAVTRVPLYVPSVPNGPRRIVHHLSFAASTARAARSLLRRWKPDVVWTVAPSLLTAPVARRVARAASVPAWLHIQDFEVEAAFMTGLLDARSAAGRLAKRFQASAMRGFAVYSSISPQMCARLRAMGIEADRVVELRNWADVRHVNVLTAPSAYRAEWGITTENVALYSGNVANKQGVMILADVARRLAHREDLTFVICGDGPQLAPLKAATAGQSNVQFHPLQPNERLGELMGLATIHLLPQLAGAADLVLPSKLTNMLASGRPVIATASPGTGLADEVEGCGLVTPPGDVEALAAAIVTLADDPGARARLGAAARLRAEERWSAAKILPMLERNLAMLAERGRLPGC